MSTDDFDEAAWRSELEHNRAEKDDFFAEHPQSPIPPEERDDFDGLAYFPPDADYRVTATVAVHDDPDPVTMDTTADTEVRYLRVATFRFELDGENHRLHAYRQETSEEDALFVPFTDATTGDETYHLGRYMELEPERDLEDGDEVTIDFNLAYSPFCAYSETFACPITPDENHLDVPVEAGERVRD